MIKQALDAYASTIKRVWEHNRDKTVGSSEIGQCARRVWYVKHGQKPDSDYVENWGATERGNLYEMYLWAPALAQHFGKNFRYGGENQKTLFWDKLSATPDGLITGLKRDALKHLGVKDTKSDCIMVEAKTADPRTNLEQAKSHNIYQTQIQMGLVRKLTKYKPHYSLLSYANASFMDDITEFVIPFDERVFNVALRRARQIMSAKKATDLKPEGWITGGTECRHCPFLHTCGIERRNLPFQDKPVDPQFKAEMQDMVREALSFRQERDENDIALRNKQDEIKTRLREKGVRRIPGLVTWSSVKARQVYDDKKLREAAIIAGVDIKQFLKSEEPSDRLVLKGDSEEPL